MTPGLAGFIAAGDDTQAWDENVAAALAALGAAFDVVPEPRRQARRLPTDLARHLRLAAAQAGLTLEYQAARGAAANCGCPAAPPIRPAPRAPPAPPDRPTRPTRPATRTPANPASAAKAAISQPVTGWQAARPHLMSELPDGPVASRIGDLVAPRALLPVVTATSTTTTYRLLNEDGKTVARLLIERPSVDPGPASTPAPLAAPAGDRRGPRLPGQARRAARVLVAAVPASSPRPPAYHRRAARRRPPPRRLLQQGRRRHQRRPCPPARRPPPSCCACSTRSRRTCAGVLADTDTEFLHDLRVSVRRTAAR